VSGSFAVHTVVTHVNPHFDELVALWLLRRFGKERFPGINESKRIYIDAGSETYNDMSADEALTQGYLLLGVGGGIFDEHATDQTDRVKDECAATLVAKYLDIDTDPALGRLLKYVKTRDLSGSDEAGLFGLANSLDVATRHNKSEVVEQMAYLLLESRYREEQEFLVHAKREFQTANFYRPFVSNRPGLELVVIESDNRRIHTFAFYASNVSVVVVKRSSGRVQIFPNHKHGLDMDGVVAAVRLAESRQTGQAINLDDLYNEGRIRGAKAWHYQKETGILMNGSLTAPTVEPTCLELATIVQCVIRGLQDEGVAVGSCN